MLDVAAWAAEFARAAARARGPGRPIVVFQMGKVGSRSLYEALARVSGRPVFHVHNLRPGTPDAVHALVRRAVIEGRRATDFVIPVRDPIARAVSTFFEVAPSDPERPLALAAETRRFLDDAPQDSVLWFERQLRPTVGVDVYATPFVDGHATLDGADGHRVLLLRAELPDARKSELVGRFLELPPPRLPRANGTAAKSYGGHYARFVAEGPLPAPYVDLVYATRFARHFFTDAERDRLAAYWKSCPRGLAHPLAGA